MKPEELRIGNWIQSYDNHFEQVIDVLCDSVNLESNEGLPYDLIEPIPLTEEWLKKFGFSDGEYRKGYKYYYPNEYSLWSIRLSNKNLGYYQFCIWIRNDELMKFDGPIQYVHQLQNLYFALTKEELTIKQK